ncbi:hypothetical protein [Moraxella lacunata]|uniref:hypothetical protein n=1 Tax=Moraxella lacunata TaxID=477 RepID=UPI003EE050A7
MLVFGIWLVWGQVLLGFGRFWQSRLLLWLWQAVLVLCRLFCEIEPAKTHQSPA